MLKKLIIVFTIFLCTSCTANYNLNIDENNISEKFTITMPKSVIDENTLQNQLEHPDLVYKDQDYYYDIKLQEDNNYYYVNYNYQHNLENYQESKIINFCYEENYNQVTNKRIIISTSNRFNCLKMYDDVNLDTVKINITTKLKVESHNADEVKGHTYTWHINGDNYQNKPINITMLKSQPVISNSSVEMAIMLCSLVIVIGGIILYYKIKFNKRSKY